MGYGAAKNSINSCLKSDGSPTPAPASPTPAPASPTPAPPSPTSAPAPPTSCDVDGCFARCVDEYGGTVTGNGDAYFCAKGCCGMSSGAISDLDKYCKYSPDDRLAECQQSCDGASSTQSKVDDCLYGCGFWGASCDVDGCLARCVDQYGGSVTSGDAYFCAKGCCGMASGAVSDHDKYCKYSSDNRLAECQQSCDGASSTQSKVDD